MLPDFSLNSINLFLVFSEVVAAYRHLNDVHDLYTIHPTIEGVELLEAEPSEANPLEEENTALIGAVFSLVLYGLRVQ